MADEGVVHSEAKGWLYHPEFPDGWSRQSLYSLARWVNGLAFRDIHFSSTGMPVIKIAEIKGGISEQTKRTQQTFDQSVRVKFGDLLFSWSGQPETSIDAFWWRGPEGWLNQHVFRVTPKDGIEPVFFFYLLRYLKPNFVGIARNKQTTGLGHVTKRDLESIEAAFPLEHEQRAISQILGTLDDKIELNRRMSVTLEAVARAMFKSWFVDFDPVRAKAGGEPHESICRRLRLTSDLLNLFPDRLVDSELGAIPEGWEVKPLDEIANYLNGLALQKFPPSSETEWLPVIKIAQLKSGSTVGADRASIHLDPDYVVDDGDVLFSWSGSLEVEVWCGGRGALNQHLFKVTSRRFPKWFFFYWTKRYLPDFRAIAAGKAVTMGHIQRKHITEALCAAPSNALLDAASEVIDPIFQALIENRRQARMLAATRDALLPKLISGELRVPGEVGK